MGLAAASAALKRKPKATAAAPVLVLAVAVRPQPASQRIFLFSYFFRRGSSAAFLICFFLKYECLLYAIAVRSDFLQNGPVFLVAETGARRAPPPSERGALSLSFNRRIRNMSVG